MLPPLSTLLFTSAIVSDESNTSNWLKLKQPVNKKPINVNFKKKLINKKLLFLMIIPLKI